MSDEPVRILLVDDFSTIRMVVKLELKRLGYSHIDEAEDGQSALAMIEFAVEASQPYSIIICDWDMPQMSGFELLERIKADRTLGDIPFLMVTADAEISSVHKALNAGATDYLVKPISPDALAKKVQKVLEIAREAAS